MNDPSVSKEHAIIEFRSEQEAILKDKNSSNGTYINGGLLEEDCQLKHNDLIHFGKDKTDYIFEYYEPNKKTEVDNELNETEHAQEENNNLDKVNCLHYVLFFQL